MVTLTLYSGPQKVAQWPVTARQAESIGEALAAWVAVAFKPSVVLSQGNVSRIVRCSTS